MTYNPLIHNRRSIRLKEYDYSQAGAYFVTICTKNRECLFGNISNDQMILNEYGEITEKCWFDLPNHYTNIQLGDFIIMPNHFHGIIEMLPVTVGVGLKPTPTVTKPTPTATKPAPTHTTNPTPIGNAQPTHTTTIHGLPEIVRALKTFSSRRINEIRQTPGIPVWQRNYYEHIICNNESLYRITKYIINNPLNCEKDNYYK